jgi:hypothetical protein
MIKKVVPLADTLSLIQFLFVHKILYQVLEHVFVTRKEILYSIKTEVVLTSRPFVEELAQDISYALLLLSLLQLWEVVDVHFVLLDNLHSISAVICRRKSPHQVLSIPKIHFTNLAGSR